jgi:hypothetical protein
VNEPRIARIYADKRKTEMEVGSSVVRILSICMFFCASCVFSWLIVFFLIRVHLRSSAVRFHFGILRVLARDGLLANALRVLRGCSGKKSAGTANPQGHFEHLHVPSAFICVIRG